MGTMSIWHWLIVLIIVMLLFGTKKIKNIGTDLGAAIKGFKEGVREGTAETPAAGNPPAANPPGVTNSTAQADPNTIDVEARTKKLSRSCAWPLSVPHVPPTGCLIR